MAAECILAATEHVLRLEGNGDVHDVEVYPNRDADVVYEGPGLDEARAAADEFAEENPCEFAARGLGAVVSCHDPGCSLVGEDGECEEAFAVSTLTEAARRRLTDYVGGFVPALGRMLRCRAASATMKRYQQSPAVVKSSRAAQGISI